MGYEVAEQLAWELPDAIIYPTGGGVGLIGMWKAFEEMESLGWIGKRRPRMIAVQSTGCAPIVKAWDEGKAASDPWPNAATLAAGLRVPKAYGDYLVVDILHQSRGTAIAVTDDEIMDALRAWAAHEGLFAAPEGAAALAGYRRLLANGFFQPEQKVVLFNTGSGLKYIDVIAAAEKQAPQSRAIGGIIGPY
jgi:threonine synthase